MTEAAPWSVEVPAADAARGLQLALEAEPAARARIAAAYGLEGLESFAGEMALSSWLDGLRMRGRWRARVTYLCGLTMEPFPDDLEGEIDLHMLPEGSRNAPAPDAEPPSDPDAPEPPELYAGEVVDVGDLLCQHLAVAIDPYPRKPGAEFTPPAETAEPSPFAALAALKPRQ
ncbi:MAG: DUF177 domain-containing protein [Caulobacteraceae bacterium]|nr:DUF177 domain-containing protein [Caulobacter sp.]